MVGQDRGNGGSILRCILHLLVGIKIQSAGASFACLLNEHAKLLDSLTLLLLLVCGHASLASLALQYCCCCYCRQIDDASSTEGIRWQLELGCGCAR